MIGPILPGEDVNQIRRYPQRPTFATLPKCPSQLMSTASISAQERINSTPNITAAKAQKSMPDYAD
jgi:hypothetical protein